MKKLVALILVAVMALSLCACGGGSSNYTPTTPEDTFAYEILKQAVPDYKEDSGDILGCGPCKIYENYKDGMTLVSAPLYSMSSKYGLQTNLAYGFFDDTGLKEYVWFGTGISQMEELRKGTADLEHTDFYVSQEVCDAVKIDTYQTMWESLATPLAGEYLIAFMDYLKNPHTIEIHSVDCYINPFTSSGTHNAIYFTVDYSAENSLGGKVSSTIGNIETNPLKLDSINSWNMNFHFAENETYAREQAGSISLDAEKLQEYVLENY